MILNFDDFFINEANLSRREIKKTIRGELGSSGRAMLRKLLRHNIVTFKFIKKNGSVRKAKGTLYPSYLPALRGGSPKPEHQFVYYDLDKHHWRSFRTFEFIKIIDINSISSKSLSRKAEELDDEDEEMMAKKDVKDVDFKKEEEKKERDKELARKHSEHHKEPEDEKKKTFKAGEKMSEEELLRRSSDFRKGTRKNKLTKEANDAFKKEHHKDEGEHHSEETHKEHHDEEHKEKKHKEKDKHNDKGEE